MQKFLAYVKQPYAEKGFIRATLDMCLRVLTALVWGYLMFILWNLLFDALVRNYNPAMKLWWCSYCFIMFFGATWLAYILLFVRDYYGEE
ncbi:MAG: hypothetical protein IKW71_00150 [Elusimicrobiaceae bacterium]|nr:hypothetical protein [Elusimicrobiaceae bacterium]